MLTPCQDRALDMLNRQGNAFLTGAAGTGKSFLLSRYLKGKHPEEFPVVASTGAAAVLVGGRTFHSFFGLGIMEGGVEASIARALRSRKLVRRLCAACCVIIDEVSMLSGATLAAAERVSRRARGKDEPWGGLKIIAVGDFAQLPPVTPGNQEKDWAFLHPSWEMSDFQPALLSTVMRAKDAAFLDVLNSVRLGEVTEEVRAFLDRHVDTDVGDNDATRLYPHRAKADAYNLHRLAELSAREASFRTEYAGEERAVESAKRALPIPEVLTLKEGALVMLRKNDQSEDARYVNGSLGHVTFIEDDTLYISLLSGDDVEIGKEIFTSLDGDGTPVATATNFPVTLAWATTIHKAQGASLDRMTVDLSALWEPGQAYVALSRVRSPEGLRIERWTGGSIRAEPLVTAFYDSLADAAERYVPRALFVPPPRAPEKKRPTAEDEAREDSKREKRAALIKEMLAERATLAAMAERADVKVDRVLLYFEKFIEDGESPSLYYLIEDLETAGAIRAAFEREGVARLKPVYEALGERVSYTDIRLVRCAMMAEGAEL